ncbi:hypothetical protein FFLO_06827 [Filobasidium floriforme]|uniref:Bromodomain and PHD finger-containing protein n=1 Tax=Filobasidium floriforme TaxID=5210 RepID=A0A8K0JE53_9TREE|nr:putative Bromodomain and PHD finger-containing protein 3 [Filobasidium floriforme]KAG7527546.1 hypothetical protein FFLO_06827 [Filobasidium floriforme]KAH8080573.1 putative Bromodomain and PHD finger-containing protein 3 [Filobasidium floriforme]
MGPKPFDIPQVSFRIVPFDEDTVWERRYKKQANLNRTQLEGYGYNSRSTKPWSLPKHYMRYIEPIESELANQVEYDMDEQDREWVDLVNTERQSQQLDRLSYELFEVIMDKLEKEWFDLVKKIPAPEALPIEDSKCSICDDGEGENSNAIVFCDGCNLAVHQDCYGVPYIPEGQWLCRKCTVEPENPVDCIFCPAEAGAFKQTTNSKWAHLLCALWVPEVSVSNPVYMEPIEGAETIPKSRWKLMCSICRVKGGACIQCDNKNCFTAFHVTCARARGNLGSMKALLQDGVLKAYCDRHMPADQMEIVQAARAEQANIASQLDENRNGPPESVKVSNLPLEASRGAKIPELVKTARAHAKKYTQGPPLVPAILVDSIHGYIQKARLKRMRECIEKICRYWSLKREARRGAPLLKRLYLEPWTASSASREQTDAEKAKKLEYMRLVRNDLERVRTLVELCQKREKEKLLQARALQEFIDEVLFPHDSKLRFAFEKISSLDRQQIFAHPVSTKDVPDYLDIIKHPMSWDQIDDRLDTHAYGDLSDFQRDIYLVLDNAMLYNPSDHPFHRLASKIKKAAVGMFADLANQLATVTAGSSDQQTNDSRSLEPSPQSLQPLLFRDSGSQRDLLAQLFAYEFRPLPPPSPLPPLPKLKRIITPAERLAQAERRKAEAEALRAAGSSRHTRSAGPSASQNTIHEEMLPKELRTGYIRSKPTSRRPTVKASSDSQNAASIEGAGRTSESADDTTVIPLRRPETGVLGKIVYSPMTDQERRAKEKQMSLVVDQVDIKETFSRFNVGYVLPEGSKRGGRLPLPPLPIAGPSRPRHKAPKSSFPRKRSPTPPADASSSDISDAPEEDTTVAVVRQRVTIGTPARGVTKKDQTIAIPESARGVTGPPSSPLSNLNDTESSLTAISAPASEGEGPVAIEDDYAIPRMTRRAAAQIALADDEDQSKAVSRQRSRRPSTKRRLIESSIQTIVPGSSDGLQMALDDPERQPKPIAPFTRARRTIPEDSPKRQAPGPPKPKVNPTLADSDTASDVVMEADDEAYALDEKTCKEPVVAQRLQAFHGANSAGKTNKGWLDPYPVGTIGKLGGCDSNEPAD